MDDTAAGQDADAVLREEQRVAAEHPLIAPEAPTAGKRDCG